MIEKNKDTVKLVIKNYPLKMHQYARNAAAAALAADSLGKFWEFHEELYKNSKKLNDEKVREIAANLGLDPEELLKEMKSDKIQSKIDRDMTDAKTAGIGGTPTIFINGNLLRDRSIEGFQAIIDSQLKKKK